ATSPKLSLYDGTHTSVDAAYQSTSSLCATGGTNRTIGEMPSSSASRTSESGRSRPDPDGPPTTATVSDERSDDCRASSTATARSITSGAFSGWIRPTKVISG